MLEAELETLLRITKMTLGSARNRRQLSKRNALETQVVVKIRGMLNRENVPGNPRRIGAAYFLTCPVPWPTVANFASFARASAKPLVRRTHIRLIATTSSS